MDAPKLRNSDWQASLDEAMPFLSRFQDQLNAISEDIRALEKTLTESGFRLDTRVTVEFGDQLAWMETGKNVWRVCLCERIESSSFDPEYLVRPLIETPAATRWRVARAVPRLLDEIASVASRVPSPVEPPGGVPHDDDIPF